MKLVFPDRNDTFVDCKQLSSHETARLYIRITSHEYARSSWAGSRSKLV
jgi:hypothetical protein